MTTVAIVEDHPIFRQGLSHVIEAAAEPVGISGVYRSLEDFLAHAPARIDLVLLDLHLPGLGGSEGVRAVRERGHHVLVVSASDSPGTVVAAIAAGADGYLTKDADASEIIRAVSVITAGGTYVSPTLASHLLAVERRKGPTPLQLSDREREILALVAAGERDQDIAEQLFISEATVKVHVRHIFEKFGVRSRTEAALRAVTRAPTRPSGH